MSKCSVVLGIHLLIILCLSHLCFVTFTPMYSMEIFGVVRKYIFFPWISVIIIIFAVTEIRLRLRQREHNKHIDRMRRGEGKIINIKDDRNIDMMSLDTFLFLTKHGHSLTIVDGYIIDLSGFIAVHPGKKVVQLIPFVPFITNK